MEQIRLCGSPDLYIFLFISPFYFILLRLCLYLFVLYSIIEIHFGRFGLYLPDGRIGMGEYLIKSNQLQQARLALSAAQKFRLPTEEEPVAGLPILTYTAAKKKLLCAQLHKQLRQRSRVGIYVQQGPERVTTNRPARPHYASNRRSASCTRQTRLRSYNGHSSFPGDPRSAAK